VAAAAVVDRGADGVRPFHEAEEAGNALIAVEDGRDEFAGRLAGIAADGTVALGFRALTGSVLLWSMPTWTGWPRW
jgi:hypothetical protein